MPNPLLQPVFDRSIGPQINLRHWELPHLPMMVSRTAAHSALELTWVEQGKVGYQVGRSRFALSTNHAMIVAPDIEHKTVFTGTISAGSIKIPRELLAEVADTMGITRGWQVVKTGPLPDAARIMQLARLIQAEAQVFARGQELIIESLTEALVIQLLQNGDEPTCGATRRPFDARIALVLDRLAHDYAQSLTIEDLARTAGMSRYHFSRRFREAVGKSPYRYLLELRLGHAARLLRRGHHNVTSAALTVGFTDFSRFSRMFRAWAGQSPEQYRRERRCRLSALVGEPARVIGCSCVCHHEIKSTSLATPETARLPTR